MIVFVCCLYCTYLIVLICLFWVYWFVSVCGLVNCLVLLWFICCFTKLTLGGFAGCYCLLTALLALIDVLGYTVFNLHAFRFVLICLFDGCWMCLGCCLLFVAIFLFCVCCCNLTVCLIVLVCIWVWLLCFVC